MRFLSVCSFILFAGGTTYAAEKVAVVAGGDDAPLVFTRPHATAGWVVSGDKTILEAGTQVVGGLGSTLDSTNGAVRAKLMGDVGGHSPFPILETSLILLDPVGADLSFELDRGRVDLVNQKKAGAAKVQVTIRGKTCEVTLKEPGTRLVIEMYSRWAKGVPFTKTPKETDVPSLALVIVAATGEVSLKSKEHDFNMKAPSILLLDGLSDQAPHAHTLDKAPDWVDTADSDQVKKIRESLAGVRQKLAKLPGGEGITRLLLLSVETGDETARRTALILLGALDDLPKLAMAMATSKHPDVADNGIMVLRHWIGRAPGQDMKLYNALIEHAKFKPAEAAVVLQLLHSFGDADLKKPETYQALIHYLESERLPIRGIANWHLVRLAPEGKNIGFKATAPADEREKAVKAWQALIPEGALPGQKK